MRFPESYWLRGGVCLAASVAILGTGCKEKNSPHPQQAAEVAAPTAAPDTKAELLRWNMATLVQAYDKVGEHDPRWDVPARNALSEFARLRAKLTETNESGSKIISTNCAMCRDYGCTDPLMAYLIMRYAPAKEVSLMESAIGYSNAAVKLERSQYPLVRKFYGALRAAEQLKAAIGRSTNTPPEIHHFRGAAGDSLIALLGEKDLPVKEADEAVNGFFSSMEVNPVAHEYFYKKVEPILVARWPQESFVYLLKGSAYIKFAWTARGSGYADTVTDKGWTQFEEKLKIADKALVHAWDLSSNDVRIPMKMLNVELGQGEGRERFDLWFNRAMKLDPNNYQACSYKHYYLEPKWHGSLEEMIAFGRECATNKNWGGRVPLVLMDVHQKIAYSITTENDAYLKRPGVWEDIQLSFDEFFKKNPQATGWHHNYAWYAYHSGKWDVLNRELTRLGPTNYEYFGGHSEFEKMIRLAGEHKHGADSQ